MNLPFPTTLFSLQPECCFKTAHLAFSLFCFGGLLLLLALTCSSKPNMPYSFCYVCSIIFHYFFLLVTYFCTPITLTFFVDPSKYSAMISFDFAHVIPSVGNSAHNLHLHLHPHIRTYLFLLTLQNYFGCYPLGRISLDPPLPN